MHPNDIIQTTILLAEDEDETREIIKGILDDAGYTVIEAANGKEAVKNMTNGKPRSICLYSMCSCLK